MDKRNLTKIKDNFSKLCRVSAEHIFLSFLLSAILALLIGAGLFYKYSILAQKTEPQTTRETIQFRQDLYQQVLEQWQVRDERFGAVDKKTYLDIFK